MTKSEPPSTLKGTSKDHPSDHPKSLSKVNFTQNILSLMRSQTSNKNRFFKWKVVLILGD